MISEDQLQGITLPYNTPHINDPDFDREAVLDMTASGPDVNPRPKRLTKDVYDSNFWGSKQINSVVMPWIPFFSNCDGFGSHIVLYEAFEYHRSCSLPWYDDLKIVNPIPSSGMDPVADVCNLDITCRYDEPSNYTTS